MVKSDQDKFSIISKFPFVMVLTTTFLRGAIFLFLNFPLITPVLLTNSYSSLVDLFIDEYISILEKLLPYIKAGGSLLIITFAVFFSLCIGLILNPVERGVSYLITLILNQKFFYNKSKSTKKQTEYYNSGSMLTADYSKLLEWFFANTNERSHWEWELFHYYISWTIFLNLAIFSGATIFLLRNMIKIHEVIFIIIANFLFLYFALLRSQIMSNVHMVYIQRTKKKA